MNRELGSYGRRGFLKTLGSIGVGLGLGPLTITKDKATEDTDGSWLQFGEETKQFFFDNVIIESAHNVTRKVHRPVKDLNRSPVIKSDKPWEHVTYFTVSSWQVIRDPEDGLFKCWYEDWKHDEPVEETPHDLETSPTRYLYAESKDGMNWEKPQLGLVREEGHNTNIVLGDDKFGSVHSGWVFLDPLEKQRQHRYKMFFRHFEINEAGERTNFYRVASSPDGINWELWDEFPEFGWHGRPSLGDVITVYPDPHANIYRMNTRKPGYKGFTTNPYDPYPEPYSTPVKPVYLHDPSRENRRRIFRAESSDMVNWTNLRPLIVPDSENHDNIDDAFYGMTQFQIGDDAWVGFLHVFHMTENTMTVQLLFSRDGENFKRIEPGQPWLETGEEGSWDQFMVNVYGTPVVVGDELYIYHGGARNHHDYWIWGQRQNLDHPEAHDMSRINYALGLARMKVDRFVSLRALDVREGIWVTRPFRAEGNKLVINAQCHEGGYIKVAVADGNGGVIKGYEAENCDVFKGDSITHEISWKSNDKVPTNRGFIKLHFYMSNADIFSFQLKK